MESSSEMDDRDSLLAQEICIDCKSRFEVIEEQNLSEIRCRDCQTKFRINNANYKAWVRSFSSKE